MNFDPNSDKEFEFIFDPESFENSESQNENEVFSFDGQDMNVTPEFTFTEEPPETNEEVQPAECTEEKEVEKPDSEAAADIPMIEAEDQQLSDTLNQQEFRVLFSEEEAKAEENEAIPDPILPELSEGLDSESLIKPRSAKKQNNKSRKRAVKKGRPRRKKGEGLLGIPNILVTVVWCALTLLISLTLGRLVWVCAAEVLAFGREDKTVTVTIYEDDTIEDITKKLARAELIHYPGLFKLYAQFAVDDGEIRPGMWDLNTKYDYHALVRMMSPSSSRDVVKVTIPEGYTCRQIFSLLEENKVCTSQDLISYAANGELENYWFLEDVVRGDKYCLEGFLFPDTYEFYKNDSPKSVLNRMLSNFNNRFDESLQWKIQELNAHLTDLMRRNGFDQNYISAHQFRVRDVVNVASMIEKETSSVQEGYTIASVIYNRLFCWGNNPPYLNIDATIVYALNGKNDLTYEDLRVDSPYNTYTNLGLTPGPIANPGLASLKAALEPSDTNFYYYVLDPAAGSHHFSTTQAEHEAFRASLGG